MWKQIGLPSDIKNYPVGTRVKVNGLESTIKAQAVEGDVGFYTNDSICPDTYGIHRLKVFGSDAWGEGYIVEVWDEPKKESLLQKDGFIRGYKFKVKGE